MQQIKLFKIWIIILLIIPLLFQCNKKETKNDPVPGPQARIEALTCTRVIKLSEWSVDGSNIPAGSVVCLESGTRGALLLKNFKGTASAPIIFINSGGKTIIKTSPSAGYGIKTEGCEFFRFSGTGSSDQYGIMIDGGNIGFALGGLSTNFEINNIEVANCGFAGIMAKTDPSCDASTWRSNFVMRDLSFHDNYVHHVKGEGFYVGNSFYKSGKSLSCGTVLPHSIINTKIFNNKVAHSGCEGIQVGCVIEGLKVYGNTVTNTGEDPFAAYQNNGIQIGEGSGGLMYNNIIKNASGNGIIMLGLGDNIVFNNIIINAGESGIFCDERYTPGNGFTFLNNTIINPGKEGIKLYSELVPMNTVQNNIIIKPGNGIYVRKNSGVKITESNNYQSADIATVKFVNAVADNYQLASGSPAIDGGINTSSYGITFDYNNGSRPSGAAYDIGALEANSSGTIPAPDPITTPTPSGQSIASLTLINANTNKDIATLTDGYVINFAAIGTSKLSIRANTSPATVGSVVFSLDANAKFRVESGAPYAINGDGGGNYYSWTPTLGAHTLTCTPYSSANATGTKGTPLSINFTVVNSVTASPPITTDPTSPMISVTKKILPAEDAYLQGTTRYNNNLLRADGVSRVVYIKYNVTGIGSTRPATAKLRLKVDSDYGSGTIRIAKGSHSNWTESNLSGSNKPAISSQVTSLNSKFDIGRIYEFNVTSAITGDGTYTFIITQDAGGNDVAFSSDEGSFRPELIIN